MAGAGALGDSTGGRTADMRCRGEVVLMHTGWAGDGERRPRAGVRLQLRLRLRGPEAGMTPKARKAVLCACGVQQAAIRASSRRAAKPTVAILAVLGPNFPSNIDGWW